MLRIRKDEGERYSHLGVLDTALHEFSDFVCQLRPRDCLTEVVVISGQNLAIMLVGASLGQWHVGPTFYLPTSRPGN